MKRFAGDSWTDIEPWFTGNHRHPTPGGRALDKISALRAATQEFKEAGGREPPGLGRVLLTCRISLV